MEKNAKKRKKKYFCIACSFSSSNHYDFNRHNSTTKHLILTNPSFTLPKKTPNKNMCKYCEKVYKHRQSLCSHLKICKTRKTPLSNVSKMYPKCIQQKFVCKCKKSYKFSSGLSKHKKKCGYTQDLINKDNIIPVKYINQIMSEMINVQKENGICGGNTTNNTINNNYTINMFLNDKCKNAMNLEDFVEKIKFTLEDLKYTADNGFTDGISNVFIKNLNGLDVTERPIHCTDQKRLQFYVKNEDVWEKDDVNLTNSIEQMSKKQGSSINEWTHANPNYLKSEKKRDEYFKIVNETMKSTDCKNIKNIKKNVSRNVKLEKKDM
jgi:hypothetical protein